MFKNIRLFCLLLGMSAAAGFLSAADPAGPPAANVTLAQRLIKTYDAVQTLTADTRKDTLVGDRDVRMLSRVWFERPDRLRVENSAPVKRLLLADGNDFFMTFADHDRGLRQPIAALGPVHLAALRTVPGTPVEDLWRLQALPEVEVPPTAEWPLRRGYNAERHFVVLSIDNHNRLGRIDFFDASGMTEHRGQTVYDDFIEPLPGVWIPRLHRSRILVDGVEWREVRRFSNLEVNKPIDSRRFDAESLVGIAEWVDDMEKFMAP